MMTAGDVIERLMSFAGADAGGDVDLAAARRALQDAYREFPTLHRWTYHYAHGRLQLKTSYSTGTVAYDNTTRHLTLTGGTWPSWAASADVRINDIVSEVGSRDSDTVLTLSSTVNPGADIDAGTTYTIYRDLYTLPADFQAADAAIAESRFGTLQYVHPSSELWATRTADRQGWPLYYTFVPDRFAPGRLAMRVVPYPDRDQTLDFIYQRRMRTIRYDAQNPTFNAGTVSVSNAGVAVTGTGTAFRSNMVGSVIRFSSDQTVPTGLEGKNQAVFETTITAYTSATSITVADTAPEALSAVAFTVADPLDIEDGAMATAFAWRALLHLANEKRMKDRAQIEQEAVGHLIRAKEADSRSFALQRAGPGGVRRPDRRYMPTGPDE